MCRSDQHEGAVTVREGSDRLISALDLAVSVPVNADRDQHGNVLDFAAPAAFQIDAVNVDIGVFAGKGAAAPLFDVFVGLLIEVADRTG